MFRARNDYVEDEKSDPGRIHFYPLEGDEVCAPPAEKTQLGRFNAPRAPVLYLSTTPEVALAEVRALPSDTCTVAHFKTMKPSKIGKLLLHGTEPFSVLLEDEPPEEGLEQWLLARTAEFVSRSVGVDDRDLHYRACALIASAFKEAGFDGVAYRTSFWSSGWSDQEKSKNENHVRAANIVFFDPNAAKPQSSFLRSINWRRPIAEQAGNSVWRAKPDEGS